MPPTKVSPNTVALDKPRELLFDFAAFEALQRVGINAMRPITYAEMAPTTGASLVWAGQLHYGKKALTREQVCKYMPTTTDGYYSMMEVVAKQLGKALGVKSDAKKE